MPETKFPVLKAAIQERLKVEDVWVRPPFVLVIVEKGVRAVRFWMPETLNGDITDSDEIRLRVPPPNARKKP